MSTWTHCSGYMVVSPDKPMFGTLHSNEDGWVGEYSFDGERQWIGQLLVTPREQCGWNYDECSVLPVSSLIEWKKYTSDEIIEEREVYYYSEEDNKKLQFPSGSEGPLNLTVTACVNKHGLVWHVVFHGFLRNYETCQPIVKWWNTLKKYLTIYNGHIYASSGKDYFEDTIYDEDYGKEEKIQIK